MPLLHERKTTKYKDGCMFLPTAHKYLPIVKELPANAVFWKTITGYVPQGIICKDVRKKKTCYHVHKVNKHGDFNGHHDLYIVKEDI